jgi:HlyD family secretion protein
MASSNHLRHHEGLSVRSTGRPVLRFNRTERIEPRLASEDGVSALGRLNAQRRSSNAEKVKRHASAVVRGAGRWMVLCWRFFANPDNKSTAEDSAGLSTRLRWALDGEVRSGARVLALSLGITGLWGLFFPLSAAVVASGTLVVQSSVKKVQHSSGGIVAEILVQDGSHVKRGDLLIRLDHTQARAKLQVVEQQLDEVRARLTRLNTERDGGDDLQFPTELNQRSATPHVERVLASERSLFLARGSARKGQKELIRNRITQLTEEVSGLDAQIQSKKAQINLVTTELQGVQSLYDSHLVPLTRLTALQREASRLEGDRAQLISSVAETKSKISEAELQIIQIDQDLRTDVTKDLRESQDKEAELTEQEVSASDQLDRLDIRAPTDGIVNQLSVHTVGGVISSAEVIMEIVPDSDDLEIESHLQPGDIDQVSVGQATHVRLSAFNQGTTPQLNGFVKYVSADLTHDQRKDIAYYKVIIALPAEEVRHLGKGLQLVSGMPAEVFMQTGKRTMVSYLLKPIADHLQRAFNER